MIWPPYFITKLTRSLGYEIQRVPRPASLSVEPKNTDPLSVDYCLSKRGRALFNIPLCDVRAFHCLGLPLNPQDHPFVRASSSAIATFGAENIRNAIRNVLDEYYASVQPVRAYDVVGLSYQEAPGLKGVEPAGFILPWWEFGVEAMLRIRRRSLIATGLQYRMSTSLESGHTFFGPVSEQKLKLEVERLSHILESVRKKGFLPFAGNHPVKVNALRSGGEYRWLIKEGQHRLAVGAVMDTEHIPAVVSSVIRREDSPFWPQVVAGVFTARGALALFDRIFDGTPPTLIKDWASAKSTSLT